MNEDKRQRPRRERPGAPSGEGAWDEAYWRELLSAYKVPDPSPGFVDRVLEEKRFQELLQERVVPEPSKGFVQDTLAQVLLEREVHATQIQNERTLAKGTSGPSMAAEAGEPILPPRPRMASHRRLWLAAAALAALLVLALLLRGPRPAPFFPQGDPMKVAEQLIQPQTFPKLGSNPFSRALSSRTASILPPPPAFIDFEER